MVNMYSHRSVLAAALLAVLLGCCDNRSAPTTAVPAGPAVASAPAQQVCYRQVVGRDTTMVRLFSSGATVTGELVVLPAEKDRARGLFRGTLTGQ